MGRPSGAGNACDVRHTASGVERHPSPVTRDAVVAAVRVEDASMERPEGGPAKKEDPQMADKKIEPKAPEKDQPAAGARETEDRKTLKHRRTLRHRKTL